MCMCLIQAMHWHSCQQQVRRAMITYQEWKDKYVSSNEHGLYVNYNAQGHSQPADAVTVSEASG